MKIFTKKLLYSFYIICALLVIFIFLSSFSLDTSDEICNENGCFPKVFVATEEFQEIHEGQEIPPGMKYYIFFF